MNRRCGTGGLLLLAVLRCGGDTWAGPADVALLDEHPTRGVTGTGLEETLTLSPGSTGAAGRPYWRKNLFKRALTDQKFLVTTWWPAESRRYAFTIPLGVALAGAIGSSTPSADFDLRWERSVEDWTVGDRRDVARALTRLGDPGSAVILVSGTYLISRWTGNERMQRVSSLSAEALLNSGLYSTVLKRMTSRTRPAAGGTGEFFVSHPEAGQSATSFPSGHATGAFAVAAVVAHEFSDKRWVPWMAYGTASLIAVSRVGLGRHFPSDILAGAVLGNSMGRMVVYRNGVAEPSHPLARLEPVFEPGNNGVGLSYRNAW